MQVRIIGTDLPGRSCVGYDDVHVGVQRARDNEQLAPATRKTVTFELELQPTGDRDARGPYVQGRKGERFIYLTWVAGPERAMFRRAKLMLEDIPADVWAAAARGGRLTGSLSLTNAKGAPLCARVRPPAITWTAS